MTDRSVVFGDATERLACLLHEARMSECYGNWRPSYRLRWPETREAWQQFQHHPHSNVLQALAQAKALIAAGWTNPAERKAA